jgi:RHS repeat-associated protein
MASFWGKYESDDNGPLGLGIWLKRRQTHVGGQLTNEVESNDPYAGGASYEITTDRLGSVRARGAERYTYFPSGEVRTSTGTSSLYAALESPLRAYDSNAGRFDRPDPLGLSAVKLGDPGSWNRFAYVQGDPVNYYDPMGLVQSIPGMCDAQYSYGNCGGDDVFWGGGGSGSGGGGGGGGGGFGNGYATWQAICGSLSPTACSGLLGYLSRLPDLTPPVPLSGNADCEGDLARGVVTARAGNLGITLGGYSFDHVTVAGLTNGGTDTMTEVFFNIGNDPGAWDTLVSQMTAAGFVQAGYDPLHGAYTQSYRQMTANGAWSMQVSYDANHNLQIDIDPHNPMQNMFGHSMDVIFNTVTGLDTNYHTAASNLGIAAKPCR